MIGVFVIAGLAILGAGILLGVQFAEHYGHVITPSHIGRHRHEDLDPED